MHENSTESGVRPRKAEDCDPKPPLPVLRIKPQPFFSNKFEWEVVDEQIIEEEEREKKRQNSLLSRYVDWEILAMILLFGVPLLLYCVISSGK